MLLPSLIRSVSRRLHRDLAKHIPVFTSCSSSLAQVSYPSDSGSDEDNNNGANSNYVSETLDHLRRQPKTALFLITHLKQGGFTFTHDVITYMAIIRFFCYWGMMKRLKLLFLDVIKDESFRLSDLLKELSKEINKNSWAVIAFDGLIKAFISVQRFDEAYDVLSKINRPSVFTCNLFMNRLVEDGKLKVAMAVFRHLKTNGFVPNVYTYGIVVKGLCKRGYVKAAGNVIQSMKKAGVEPDSFTFGSYIHGLCSNGCTDSAFELLKCLTGSSSVIDVFAYSCVVRGFVKECRLQDAENVLFDMKQTNVDPDAYCYGALIEGYCRKGETDKASDLHDQMCSEGINTNCVIVSSIMQSLCNLGLWSEAYDQFIDAKESGVVLDGISFNIAIDALCKLGRTSKARLLLQEMKKNKEMKPPDVRHYTTLIHGFCLRKDLDIALEIFDEMINEMGLKPDTITFNVLIGGFAKCGRVVETRMLLNDMLSRGLKPTSATYNIGIQGLCQAGKAKEARQIFDNLETKILDNYVAMMNGYRFDTTNVREAYQLFLNLSNQGKDGLLTTKKAGCRCLRRLISRLCEERDTDRALTVFKTYISTLDDVIIDNDNDGKRKMYSQLQFAYCEDGNVKMARRVFDTMIARGLRPDVTSYTIMLTGYFRVKRLTEVHHLLKDMKDRGIEPDLISYTVLLDHGSKLHDMEGAVCLFKKMKDEGLKPDVIAYTSLIYCYYCHVFVEKAEAAYYDMLFEEGLRPDLRADQALILVTTVKDALRRNPPICPVKRLSPLYVLSNCKLFTFQDLMIVFVKLNEVALFHKLLVMYPLQRNEM